MSLTLIARSAAFLLLGTLAAYGGWVWALPMARYVVAAQDSTSQDLRIADRMLAYRLGEQEPLSFAFSQPVDNLRLLTHAATASPPTDAEGLMYRLKVSLFDGDGNQLAEHEQALLAGRDDGYLPDGRARRFYRTGDLAIWGVAQLVVENDTPFTRVDITLIEADALVTAVDVRVYERRPVLAGEERDVLLRRSAQERATLTAFSPFPAEMLTEDEVRNLARNLWRPVGPVGVEGRDYDALVIYAAQRGEEGAS